MASSSFIPEFVVIIGSKSYNACVSLIRRAMSMSSANDQKPPATTPATVGEEMDESEKIIREEYSANALADLLHLANDVAMPIPEKVARILHAPVPLDTSRDFIITTPSRIVIPAAELGNPTTAIFRLPYRIHPADGKIASILPLSTHVMHRYLSYSPDMSPEHEDLFETKTSVRPRFDWRIGHNFQGSLATYCSEGFVTVPEVICLPSAPALPIYSRSENMFSIEKQRPAVRTPRDENLAEPLVTSSLHAIDAFEAMIERDVDGICKRDSSIDTAGRLPIDVLLEQRHKQIDAAIADLTSDKISRDEFSQRVSQLESEYLRYRRDHGIVDAHRSGVEPPSSFGKTIKASEGTPIRIVSTSPTDLIIPAGTPVAHLRILDAVPGADAKLPNLDRDLETMPDYLRNSYYLIGVATNPESIDAYVRFQRTYLEHRDDPTDAEKLQAYTAAKAVYNRHLNASGEATTAPAASGDKGTTGGGEGEQEYEEIVSAVFRTGPFYNMENMFRKAASPLDSLFKSDYDRVFTTLGVLTHKSPDSVYIPSYSSTCDIYTQALRLSPESHAKTNWRRLFPIDCAQYPREVLTAPLKLASKPKTKMMEDFFIPTSSNVTCDCPHGPAPMPRTTPAPDEGDGPLPRRPTEDPNATTTTTDDDSSSSSDESVDEAGAGDYATLLRRKKKKKQDDKEKETTDSEKKEEEVDTNIVVTETLPVKRDAKKA